MKGVHSRYDTFRLPYGIASWPYGESLDDEHQNSINTAYKYNGKERDSETGLYYYGARFYDPTVSLWLSVDPLAEQMPEWSSYNYVFSNPLKYHDPTGMAPEIVDDIIFENNCGEEIGRIILPGDDITHQINTDYSTPDPIKVDPVKLAEKLGIPVEDVDALGIDLGYTGVVGGGMHFGAGVVHFLDGDSKGDTYFFGHIGGGVGLDAGIGLSGFISNFDDNANIQFFRAEGWEGNYAGYSIGVGGVNLNYSWGNEQNIEGQLWPGQNIPVHKSSPPTWHTWTGGGAYSGEARGGASTYWGESSLQYKFL